jgi:threonine/homoserine/homoserine lactone efflux protein
MLDMLNSLFHFAVGCLVSYLGSIPPAVINVFVAETAVREGIKKSMVIAIGVAVVEFAQAYVAIRFIHWLSNDTIQEYFKMAAMVIFYLLGFYNLRLAYQKKETTMGAQIPLPPFSKGMVMSATNMLAIPYWIVNSAYLNAHGWLDYDHTLVLIFSFGTAVGTVLLLWTYGELAKKLLKDLQKIHFWTNLIIGILFIGLATTQLVGFIAR